MKTARLECVSCRGSGARRNGNPCQHCNGKGAIESHTMAFDECANCDHWRGGHQPSGCRQETETARGLLHCNCDGFVEQAKKPNDYPLTSVTTTAVLKP